MRSFVQEVLVMNHALHLSVTFLKYFLVGFVLLLTSCAQTGSRTPGEPSNHYYWRPASTPVGWLIFLPGASGLKVLNDDRHYFHAAERLNLKGWSVLLVDYKAAYQAAGNKPDKNTGEKIAWVTEQAVDWLHRTHPETLSQPSALVAWSLGAEGGIRLANDKEKVSRLGIRAMCFYYPSNQQHLTLHNQLPLLILTGAADDVTAAKDIEKMIKHRDSNFPPVNLHIFPEAHHGFDVASITERQTIRLLPMIGPKATMQYNAVAAAEAEKSLSGFLADYVIQHQN
jgi:dienelactone hydrolase